MSTSVTGADILADFLRRINQVPEESKEGIPLANKIDLLEIIGETWNQSQTYDPTSRNTLIRLSSTEGSRISLLETRGESFNRENVKTAGSESISLSLRSSGGDVLNRSLKDIYRFTPLSGIETQTYESSLEWRFIGEKQSKDDDVNLRITTRSRITNEKFQAGGQKTSDITDHSISLSESGPLGTLYTASYRVNHSYQESTQNIPSADREVTTINRLHLLNAEDNFESSLRGTLTNDRIANIREAQFSNITISLNNITYHTASITSRVDEKFFLVDFRDITNVQALIEDTLFDLTLRGDNIIRGSSGDDTIKASTGNDVIDGGRGKDTLDLSDFTWTLDNRSAETYTVIGSTSSFTIRYRNETNDESRIVASGFEFVRLDGQTHTVAKFLSPRTTQVEGGFFLDLTKQKISEDDLKVTAPGYLSEIDFSRFTGSDYGWTTQIYDPDASRTNLLFNASNGASLRYVSNNSTQGTNGNIDSWRVAFSTPTKDALSASFQKVTRENISDNRQQVELTESMKFRWVEEGDPTMSTDNSLSEFNYNYLWRYDSSATVYNTIYQNQESQVFQNGQYQFRLAINENGRKFEDSEGIVSNRLDQLKIGVFSFIDFASSGSARQPDFQMTFSGSRTRTLDEQKNNIYSWTFKNVSLENSHFKITTRLSTTSDNLEGVTNPLESGDFSKLTAALTSSFMFLYDFDNVINVKNKGGEIINGGLGNDAINGNDGNDIIIGGKGIDTLRGGRGNDTFVIDGETRTNNDVDRILDFKVGEDKIMFSQSSGIMFEPDTFVTVARGVKEQADKKFLYDRSNGNLYYDPTDANNDSILIATFTNRINLTANDFSIESFIA